VRRTLIFGIVYSYAGNAKGITIPVTLVSPYGTYRASAKQAVYGSGVSPQFSPKQKT